MAEKPQHRLATTARIGGRLNSAEQADTRAKLITFAPQKPDFKYPLEIEIGCGNGLALLKRAESQPDTLFIANDVFLPGLATLASHLKKSGLTNVRLVPEDARDLLEKLPAKSAARILVPFPDPWPKTRHHKRRLVQPDLLAACHRVLKDDGELWVITDWPSYAYHAISTLHLSLHFNLAGTMLEAANAKPTAKAHSHHLGPGRIATPPGWWVETKYQSKAIQAGRATWYLLAHKAKK